MWRGTEGTHSGWPGPRAHTHLSQRASSGSSHLPGSSNPCEKPPVESGSSHLESGGDNWQPCQGGENYYPKQISVRKCSVEGSVNKDAEAAEPGARAGQADNPAHLPMVSLNGGPAGVRGQDGRRC